MRALTSLLLIIVCTSLHSAVETFKLTDGRTLVGEYDEAAGQLHATIGKVEATIAVAPDQIASRSPYIPKDAPPAEPKKPMSPETKAAYARAAAEAKHQKEIDDLVAQASVASRDAAQARKEAAAKRESSKRLAAAFRERAAAEGEPRFIYQVTETEGSAMTTKKGTTNAAVLTALEDAKKLDAKAEMLDAKAKEQTAAAAALRSPPAPTVAAAPAKP